VPAMSGPEGLYLQASYTGNWRQTDKQQLYMTKTKEKKNIIFCCSCYFHDVYTFDRKIYKYKE